MKKMNNKWLYVCMLLGVILAFSRDFFDEKYHQWILVLGMALLFFGIYSLSRNLPPKRKEDFENQLTKRKEEE
ncbi:hypothetical protein [Capnocytophaga canimorsus]|uniref:hypothetical protein n=1 Tax=Capnocytophaga canimorsus TaxID=28188 RepID=UPI00385C982F